MQLNPELHEIKEPSAQFNLSIAVDSDFMALYDEAKKAIGQNSAEEVFKCTLRNFLDKRLEAPKRLSKAERAKLEYVEVTSHFVPRIIRRAA